MPKRHEDLWDDEDYLVADEIAAAFLICRLVITKSYCSVYWSWGEVGLGDGKNASEIME